MKRILIVNNNMHIGGVQKALVSLLWNLPADFEVTLLLFSPTGECLKQIPPHVRVIPVKSAYRYLGLPRAQTRRKWDKLCRSFFAAVTRVFGCHLAVGLMSLGQKKIKGYDIAISYLHNAGNKLFYGGCNDFVIKHVSAEKKITFLHCDYLLCGANTPQNRKLYEKFDAIAACSGGCAEAFVQANPHLREKVLVVPNCHRFDQIRRLAEEAPVKLPQDRVNVVTVARLGKEKGVERALKAIAMLPNKDKLHYHIIGDGVQMPLVRDTIDRERLSDTVTLYGMLENPYGYLRAADLLLIPSYSEAAPLVIGEAACLETPILSTETSSAREMIEKTGFGWVCENSEEAMTAALQALLENPKMLKSKKTTLSESPVTNEKAVKQFLSLMNM
ncbi:MAG: glycosyltransferase [Ruminococcaceae bacterium]|nr:glycosyltransferase [Oscillospiraceae bacterium]